MPQTKAFEPPPSFPGYLQTPAGAKPAAPTADMDLETLVRTITNQVIAALGGK
jgi:hypothetical protein